MSQALKAPLKTREEAIAIARSWIGTPYRLTARIKGVGADCGTFLAEYLIEIGATTREELEDLGFYSHDWFCHASDERYMLRLLRHARLVAETVCRGGAKAQPEALPGNLVLFRVVGSKRWNHGAVITDWPRGVHAVKSPCVSETNLTSHSMTGWSQMEIFDPWSSDVR